MKPLSLSALSLQLGALAFGDDAGEKCLAIHGWMDNAASFTPLATALPECHVVSIDLPGHGLSTHLPEGCHYHLLDQVSYILAAADALGWHQFNLLAHSLGACIAPFVAVAAPERISRLVMVDGIGPPTESAEALPARLKRSVAQSAESRDRLTRIYSHMSDAVDARLAATRMDRKNAELIVERSLRETSGGFTWRFDSKIRLPSPSYLSTEQVQACLSSVACPSLLILAEQGVAQAREYAETRIGYMPRGVLYRLPGFHHVHMDHPDSVAAAVRRFFIHSAE